MGTLNSPSPIKIAARIRPSAARRVSSVASGSYGVSGDVSRAWLDQTMPADVQVSAAVYVSTLIPAQVIARGSNLNAPDGTNGPSFYAVELSNASPGPKLELVKDVNGTETSLGSINSPTYLDDQWLQETLDVEGSTVRAQLFDPTTGEYLNSAGQWQTTQAWALTVLDNSVTGPGVVGLGRPSSYTGTVTFDDFSVQTPATVQSFDATPVGLLPDNWSQWGTGGGNFVAVASPTNPAPPSGPNALAIAPPQSGDTARAWLNTSLPADLSASAETYISTLTPAQVLARGSNLNSDTPTYYAVEVSRGMTVKLVKVVDGGETDLASLTSTSYVQDIWVQETLALSGNTLMAQIYRPDTGEYLNASGDWQSTPTWALQATDTSITAGGQAGVARPVVPEYVESNYFDNFTTATGMDAQSFDASNALPTGWQQWSSDGKNSYFAVAAAPSSSQFLSANNVLQSTGGAVTAQTWDTNESLTNAQVSAGMYLSSSLGMQLFARGTSLSSTQPSYYGLSVTPSETGPVVELVRVNAGTATVLGQLLMSSSGYVDDLWIQETLYVDGTSVRAQVYRADTGQYLNSQGLWQATPDYALNVTDTSSQALTGPGYGGIARPSGAGTISFDNFAVTPLSTENTPPAATVTAPSGTLSGVVTVSATATDAIDGVTKVEFYVDNVLRWVDTAAPYTWAFDTSFVPNGTHTLLVKAYDDADNVGVASTTVTTSNNTTLTMPSFPRHQSSIGITELDYGSGNFDPTLLQNNVDAVVVDYTNLSDLAKIHNAYPSDQELIYTNVSNIYLGLLSNWLNYAEQNGIDAEQAFYHVSVATPFTYADYPGSTQPVDWFWGVYGYQNGSWSNFTQPANGFQSKSGVPFGNLSTGSVVGDTMNVGYTDKFREIDINLSQARSGGSYVLEYPTAVDSNGNPTTWATLTTLSDTTNGLTTTGPGTITFDPPSNWVPAAVDGTGNNSPQYYYVRFRTTAAFSTIPVASTILGANYTQAVDNGTQTTGTIPAFDYAADKDGDGYLNAQEYANRSPGMNAYFAYQSRLFDYGQMRFYTNPSSPAFQAWAAQYYPAYLKNNEYATGLFVDNSQNNPPGQQGTGYSNDFNLYSTNLFNFNLVESTASYSQDYASLLNAIGRDIAPSHGWIMANTAGALPVQGTTDGQTNADPVIQKVQAYYEETGLQASSENTTQFLAFYNRIYYRATYDLPSYAVLDSTSADGQADSEEASQTQLTTLAAYYLLAPSKPSQGALDFYGGENKATNWVNTWGPPAVFNHWSQAATYNVGTPVSALPSTPDVFTSGTESDGSTYYVYDRKFTGQNGQPVLILYKPVSSSDARGSGTATTVTLNGSYYVLQANGTLSSTAQTTISLENGEGAILVQAGTSTPTIAGTAMVVASSPTSPVAAASSTQATSGSPSANQSSSGPTTSEHLTAEFFERLRPGLFVPNAAGQDQASMGLPADQLDPSAGVDRFLSLWAAEKMTALLAGGNGLATSWPAEGNQAQTATPIPPATIPSWLGSARLPKTHGNNSLSEESSKPADDVVAQSLSGSSVDDPLASSSAS